jgi:hypothetical protein
MKTGMPRCLHRSGRGLVCAGQARWYGWPARMVAAR